MLKAPQLEVLKKNRAGVGEVLAGTIEDERYNYYRKQMQEIKVQKKDTCRRNAAGEYILTEESGSDLSAYQDSGEEEMSWPDEILKNVSADKRTLLSSAAIRIYPDGHKLLNFGEVPDCVFVVRRGEVDIVGRDDNNQVCQVSVA